MFFSTANSSFILDRRRRSMRLWAVLRAILRPAALVDEGCFLLPAAVVVLDPASAGAEEAVPATAVVAAAVAELLLAMPDFPAPPADRPWAESTGDSPGSVAVPVGTAVRGFI